MYNLFLSCKIKRDLRLFKIFKNSYSFEFKKVVEKDNGSLFCDDICIKDGKDGEWVGETENFVNVGYNIHGAKSKVLSNLFPYDFYFRGFKIKSIEGIFQGLKYRNKSLQKMVFSYFGLNSNHIKAGADYNWIKDHIVYFQGKAIDRNGLDYGDFIDEMYISAIQNKLYRSVLKNIGSKYILHAMGERTKDVTLFTREEFERELNCLKDFVIWLDCQ